MLGPPPLKKIPNQWWTLKDCKDYIDDKIYFNKRYKTLKGHGKLNTHSDMCTCTHRAL